MIRLIEGIAEKFLQELGLNGYINPGHNGPYNDIETPARNTAHWLITFSYLFYVTDKEKYYDAVYKCGNYLVSDNARPMHAVFYCRKNPKKDFTNGIIGQAWVIEALIEAYKVTKNDKYLNTALEVFLLHPFSEQKGIWKIVNIDGSIKNYDMTFNHQLWFAAAGSIIYDITKSKKIKQEIDIFFNKLNDNLNIHKCGLIRHSILFKTTTKDKIKKSYKSLKLFISKAIKDKDSTYKEFGYHIFNVYAFAILHENGFGTKFYNEEKFNKILKYTFSDELLENLKINNNKSDITNIPVINNNIKVNRYGYAYNAPGFEIPYIYEIFKTKINENINIENIINEQLSLTYNKSEKLFSNNTEDKITLTSRIYELTRYLRLK